MGKLFTRTGLAFLSAVLMGAAACSTDAAAPPASSPSATPPTPAPTTPSAPGASTGPSSQSPTSGETPTVETVRPEINIPEPEKYPEMANDDLQGADTAARYFLDLYGYVYNTGDLGSWRNISDPSCEKCSEVAKRVENYYNQGQWFENFAMLHGQSTIYYPSDEYPFYLVTFEVAMSGYTHFDSSGKPLEQTKELRFPKYSIGVKFVAPNEWLVVGATEGGGSHS